MKAHKVPATYFDGWKASGYGESFYVFYVNDLTKPGILKKFRHVDKLTSEHRQEHLYSVYRTCDNGF